MTDLAVFDDLARIGHELGREAMRLGGRIVTAESCTAGLIAVALTEAGGASDWFERGVASYSNAAKRELLGVTDAALTTHGAVSEVVAGQLGEPALELGGERGCGLIGALEVGLHLRRIRRRVEIRQIPLGQRRWRLLPHRRGGPLAQLLHTRAPGLIIR